MQTVSQCHDGRLLYIHHNILGALAKVQYWETMFIILTKAGRAYRGDCAGKWFTDNFIQPNQVFISCLKASAIGLHESLAGKAFPSSCSANHSIIGVGNNSQIGERRENTSESLQRRGRKDKFVTASCTLTSKHHHFLKGFLFSLLSWQESI